MFSLTRSHDDLADDKPAKFPSHPDDQWFSQERLYKVQVQPSYAIIETSSYVSGSPGRDSLEMGEYR